MIRDIKIKPVLNGFIVECGCQTLVCEDVDKLTKEINTYFKNPDEVESEWINNSINSKFVQGVLRSETQLIEREPEPEQIRGFTECNAVSSVAPSVRLGRPVGR